MVSPKEGMWIEKRKGLTIETGKTATSGGLGDESEPAKGTDGSNQRDRRVWHPGSQVKKVSNRGQSPNSQSF